ncbi:DNA mismatch repair protein MutS [Oceanispirochaeta crateris]|uniref:DNA mismatch repair protein MutS n=1 Tax=Oceanispirochaeta crateris TaxID=2518645 RepID=A0A5C1QM76_9SPIO|nr:DNA mismatch repair protein MutS [Oceanispirochaeta crateris]QEN07656.1 DNA mismatch repair protein MutS [Oceanispirochaeta crateris]
MTEKTPMMRQYMSIKEKHKDSVLFFRMGDFYEMFRSDAEDVSRLLNLTLTKRHGIPMCGIPYHAAQNYIGRLLNAGRKIAICEQISLPKKGIAVRDVVEIITPGTVVDESFLDKKSNNYLAAIGKVSKVMTFSYVDLSTGEFMAASCSDNHPQEFIRKELSRLGPREILIQESLFDEAYFRSLSNKSGLVLNRIPDWLFDTDSSYRQLTEQFQVANLKGFGFQADDPAIAAAGVLLEYLKDTARHYLTHLGGLKKYSEDLYVSLDDATQKNLELIRNMDDGSSSFTLLNVLDETSTSMGARKMRQWILNPLRSKTGIDARLEAVSILYKNQILLSEIRSVMSHILDMERLSSRIGLDKAHAKDLLSLKDSLKKVFEIEKILEKAEGFSPICTPVMKTTLQNMADQLEEAIMEDPSILLTEGRIIRKGYDSSLDELRELKNNSRAVLDDYLNSIKEETGITNLKLKYNKIIGYFLEISKLQSDLVPDHFIRRQSLVGAERYTTSRLGDLESGINSASEKIVELEKSLFIAIREKLKPEIPVIQELCNKLSELDCYSSLAYTATIRGYVRPQIRDDKSLLIEGGRHPVVEAHLPPGEFIPNSLHMDDKTSTFALITGPNMAGKSTFLRQTALIVLMAQIGSYIPADQAVIGTVDRIFCRVGASDNLARGESTFLVEMNETAHILRNAGERSLVIMDEIGRGTSTNDGLSIAWSIAEYLLEDIRSKTLFATHYHELTNLEHDSLMNLSLSVQETGDDIVFLKKIKEGPANNSYGIHVASLAGLPEEVVSRARQILESMELHKQNSTLIIPETQPVQQQDLFSSDEIVLDQLKSVNIDNMTPLEALNILHSLQENLKN